MAGRRRNWEAFQDFITTDEETLTTSSLKVAVMHKKSHDNVVQLMGDEAGAPGYRTCWKDIPTVQMWQWPSVAVDQYPALLAV